MLAVLVVVFAITARATRSRSVRGRPPRGVHMPDPSMLPVVMSAGFALLGAGLAFRSEDQIANPFLAIPGVRSEEHTSELQSPCKLVWRLLLENKNVVPPNDNF